MGSNGQERAVSYFGRNHEPGERREMRAGAAFRAAQGRALCQSVTDKVRREVPPPAFFILACFFKGFVIV